MSWLDIETFSVPQDSQTVPSGSSERGWLKLSLIHLNPLDIAIYITHSVYKERANPIK